MTPKIPCDQEPYDRKSPDLCKYTYKITSICEYISFSIENPFYGLII
jgi:hypothetical protein